MNGSKQGLYEELKRQILTLELEPDDVLDEASLSEQFGLSRTPVREVFRRLEGEGYVDIRANRGARVAPMNHHALRHFFLVAPMVYSAIGRLAVQNFKPRELLELRETQERFRQAHHQNDPLALVLENNRFHEIIGEMSANTYLLPSLKRLLIDHARVGYTFFRPRDDDMRTRLVTAVEHHDAFIEAIASHREDAVVELVFAHWELSRGNLGMFVAANAIEADFGNEGSAMFMEKAS